jgi:hypothetical protein
MMEMGHSNRRIEVYFICVLLIGVVLGSYWPGLRNGFVYDDSGYVVNNYPIHNGLTVSGLAWAYTTFHTGNWHPVTWISHMLDTGNFQANPAGHHLTSLLLHMANTLLLFGALTIMTGLPWRSAFVAALFAAHPLHVESVAWVSERKDLLSMFFGLLAILAYVRYTQRQAMLRDLRLSPDSQTHHRPAFPQHSRVSYLLVALAFLLALMSKPMLASLPFLLLLLDYWPLGRGQGTGDRGQKEADTRYPTPITRLLWEKAPLFAMAAASAVVTMMAQREGATVATTANVPIGARVANAAVAAVAYVRKMFWPDDLAVFYPHPLNTLPWWHVAGSVALLVAVSVLVFRYRARRYLVVGWLWYLITLVPVVGIVQVGGQAMADRYTYLPLTGLFIILAWGLPDVLRGRRGVAVLTLGAVLATGAMTAATRLQVRHWKDDLALFTQAARHTRNNWVAQNQLACVHIAGREPGRALPHAREAVRIQPYNANSRVLLGLVLTRLGRLDEAEDVLIDAVVMAPESALGHACLADVYRLQGHEEHARDAARAALEIEPDNEFARGVLRKIGRR